MNFLGGVLGIALLLFFFMGETVRISYYSKDKLIESRVICVQPFFGTKDARVRIKKTLDEIEDK